MAFSLWETQMANRIYMVGHGRQYTGGTTGQLPAGVTVNFAVPTRCLSTGSVSQAHLSGDLTVYSETITGPCAYDEHYLCADVPEINQRKLQAFWSGVGKGRHQNSWLVTVRGNSDVKLGAIIARLEQVGLSKPFEIVWTCCRSPINQIAEAKYLYKSGALVREACSEKKPTDAPGTADGHNRFDSYSDGILTIVHQSDIARLKADLLPKPTDKMIKISSDQFNWYSPLELFGDPRSKSFGDTSLAA
jgi:hypothetical protein